MSEELVLDALQHNNLEFLKKAVVQTSVEDIHRLFYSCASHGNLQHVKMLLPFVDPRVEGSWALCLAARNGHSRVVEFLIPHSNPLDEGSRALRKAATEGHVECVKLLIPVSNPYDDESAALWAAALWMKYECVELLIPVSNPKADHSRALQITVGMEDFDGFCLLYSVSDTIDARQHLRTGRDELFDSLEARYLKKILEDNIDVNPQPLNKRKI